MRKVENPLRKKREQGAKIRTGQTVKDFACYKSQEEKSKTISQCNVIVTFLSKFWEDSSSSKVWRRHEWLFPLPTTFLSAAAAAASRNVNHKAASARTKPPP